MKKYALFCLLLVVVSSCVKNPNVTEDKYLNTPHSMPSWITGMQRQLAITLNQVVVNSEIISDNYFNNYSQYSKVFDIPDITYIDADVTSIQASILTLKQMADYGLTTVSKADQNGADTSKGFLYYCRAVSQVLGGEMFVSLPSSSLGPIHTSDQLFADAMVSIDSALLNATKYSMKNVYLLLKDRIYYNQGNVQAAKNLSDSLIKNTSDILYQVVFDGTNGIGNEMQNATFDALPNRLAPLPRLDFLDPKYYYIGTAQTNQKPLSFAKIEEAYLILAEAYLSNNNIAAAKESLYSLLNVIAKRPTANISDKLETRNGGNRGDYPLTAVQVRADATQPYQSGLVLNRQVGNITAYTVSGTSVKKQDIDTAQTVDDMLYLVYLLRQQVFFAEGRRSSELGIRLPICLTEAQNNPNVKDADKKALIPSFIPLKQGMDDFTVDPTTKNITIKYDMNRILINNKSSKYVVPFF